jgi:hypothetical protein
MLFGFWFSDLLITRFSAAVFEEEQQKRKIIMKKDRSYERKAIWAPHTILGGAGRGRKKRGRGGIRFNPKSRKEATTRKG